MEPKALSKRDTMLLHIIPTLLVFLAFISVSLWSSYSAKQDVNKEKKRLTTQLIKATEQSTNDRMTLYAEVLRAGVGLFNASDYVSRSEWQKFTATFNIKQHYPGLQGFGFVEMIPPTELAKHEANIRSEGFPNYKVFPEGQREMYSSLIYIDPFDEKNQRVFGYDMYSQPVRRSAMDEARDTNMPILSEHVQLLQDADVPNEPGLLMFLPVYKTGAPISTVEQRRNALHGYVYAPFRSRDFFGDIFNSVNAGNPAAQIRVYEGDISKNILLYESPGFASMQKPLVDNVNSKIRVNDRDLTFSYRISEDSISKTYRSRPANSLFGGVIFSAILAGLVLVLLVSRTRALRYAEAREVQQAKDDLLSLASHQLRTPATGVKQYVGMLRQGYAGKLTHTQIDLLEKAYLSNERQLGIIDEILHVARIDTGRIILSIKKFNMSQLVRDVTNEQREAFRRKQQKLHLHLPRKSILLLADAQYLRMVVENIINNASKYTPERGKINVYLKSDRQNVIFVVRDTGVGIARQEHDLLFKKFSRIHNELTRQTEGSGIGLYISKKIIDLHNGTIEVDSEPDAGTTFTVTIPKKPSVKP